MQIINDIDQGSEEWLAIRLGFITASKFKDVIAGGAGKTRKSYMLQLAAEISTEQRVPSFNNAAMEWGNEVEPQARAMYELNECVEVKEIAFAYIDHTNIGCSPDGLVGDCGLVEFKCPNTTTQIETYLSGRMPTSHNAQVQGQLWVMEREWCDFVSFDPRINGPSGYFCTRIVRDEDYIKKISDCCDTFSKDLKEIILNISK